MGQSLNTNVIIEMAGGNEEVFNTVLKLDRTFYVASITRFELLVNLPRKEEPDMAELPH